VDVPGAAEAGGTQQDPEDGHRAQWHWEQVHWHPVPHPQNSIVPKQQ
jgi:hypothetical protein